MNDDNILRVLLLEDSEQDALLLLRELERGAYTIRHTRVETEESLKEAVAAESWDVVISDFRMPRFDAPAALQVLKELGVDIPFIIVSGRIGEHMAVAAIKAGAHDYLQKDDLSRLNPAIERELREAAARRSQRQADHAIRAGKMEWEAVIDSVTDLIFLTTDDGTIVRCNRKAIEYFNTDYHELISRNIGAVFYGSHDNPANIFRIPSTLQESFSDVTFPTLKGWYHVSICPMHSAKELTGVVHVIKDITESKQMEEEKRISDRELLTLHAVAFRLNSKIGAKKIMNDLLLQLHNILQIDFASIHLLEDNFLRLKASFGLSPTFETAIKKLPNYVPWLSQVLAGKPYNSKTGDRELPSDVLTAANDMGMQAWCVVPLKIGQEVMGVLMVAHRSEKTYSDREVFLLTSIASQLAVLIENHALYDQMKEKHQELQRNRQELKDNLLRVEEANQELERLNDAKNSFIGMASHELKTPITSILGGVEFLLKYSGISMTPEQSSIFTSVHEGITQLKILVDDLLSISRLEADGITLQKRLLNMVPLCRDVLETFALPLSKRRIAIHIWGDETTIPADEAFAKLAVRNLLENAIKFTPDGGEIVVAGRIEGAADLLEERETLEAFYPGSASRISDESSFYRVDVSDSGIGIPSEERVRVFEKFYGVGDIAYHSSGKTEFMSKGTGLGLAIVRGIMDAHGGFVWVTEGPRGVGSSFSLIFPVS